MIRQTWANDHWVVGRVGGVGPCGNGRDAMSDAASLRTMGHCRRKCSGASGSVSQQTESPVGSQPKTGAATPIAHRVALTGRRLRRFDADGARRWTHSFRFMLMAILRVAANAGTSLGAGTMVPRCEWPVL